MRISGLTICRSVNRLFGTPPLRGLFRPPALGERRDLASLARWELEHAPGSLDIFSPYHDITGKTVLDFGCGLGGKSIHYALAGARSVTALDIDDERIAVGRELAARTGASNIRFTTRLADDAVHDAAGGGGFDLVIFNDAFEHVDDPASALRDCRPLLARGGRILLAFPPYGSAWGAHLFAYVHVPWAHLLFEERTLLRVWKDGYDKDLCRGSVFFSSGRKERIERASSLAALRQLNRMSIARFEDILAAVDYRVLLVRRRMHRPFPSFAGRRRRLREHLVARVAAVLEK